jgi:hypothetical protein
MQSYASFIELANVCAQHAHFTQDREVARELWRMALEYQRKAAALDSGKLPDIGRPPSLANGRANGPRKGAVVN